MKLSKIDPLLLMGLTIFIIADHEGKNIHISGHTFTGHNNPLDISFEAETLTWRKYVAMSKKLDLHCEFVALDMVDSKV